MLGRSMVDGCVRSLDARHIVASTPPAVSVNSKYLGLKTTKDKLKSPSESRGIPAACPSQSDAAMVTQTQYPWSILQNVML